jgi:outer membrane protein OmpA-like peptidoglycan-associated protein
VSGVAHIAISVSDTYQKVYVNGRRVVIDPDGVKRPMKQFGIRLGYGNDGVPLMVTNVRLAEGGKEYHKEWVSLARIVTHGITFDSASDVLRPESGPTLRSILRLLQDDRSLRFAIEGHTDSQGGEAVNGPLSERRAAAVKAWLVGQGVDEARLTAKGLGASKPLATDDTPEGRATNRRVELVKAGGT